MNFLHRAQRTPTYFVITSSLQQLLRREACIVPITGNNTSRAVFLDIVTSKLPCFHKNGRAHLGCDNIGALEATALREIPMGEKSKQILDSNQIQSALAVVRAY